MSFLYNKVNSWNIKNSMSNSMCLFLRPLKFFFFFWDNYFMKYLSSSSLTERLQIKMIFLVVIVVFLFKTPACYTLSIIVIDSNWQPIRLQNSWQYASCFLPISVTYKCMECMCISRKIWFPYCGTLHNNCHKLLKWSSPTGDMDFMAQWCSIVLT